MAQGKILVVRGGAIGDFILTLPVLAALRAAFPSARLEVLGYPHIAQLALEGGLVDAVRSIEAGALAGFFVAGGTLDQALQDYFSGFNIVLSFLYDPDKIFKTNVGLCSQAQFLSGPHRPDETLSIHAASTFLKPLERLAVFGADPVPRLRLKSPVSAVLHSGRPQPRRTVALHPGSGSERKNWPEQNWSLLMEELHRLGDLHILLVGGEAEGSRLERLAARFPTGDLEIARSLPLTELARRLSSCAVFVGHDSGISHLAAALGIPTVVLWGATKEAIWRPPGANVTVLRSLGNLAALSVEGVFAVLKASLAFSANPALEAER
ncbi:MAG: glycosyltransferase family 9 protein [Verrucomicrobia bacterium]|nr:glycosyltransferase family 9 protein [Verrucomicrobiota bacterium]